jgi:hypothetical protein
MFEKKRTTRIRGIELTSSLQLNHKHKFTTVNIPVEQDKHTKSVTYSTTMSSTRATVSGSGCKSTRTRHENFNFPMVTPVQFFLDKKASWVFYINIESHALSKIMRIVALSIYSQTKVLC